MKLLCGSIRVLAMSAAVTLGAAIVSAEPTKSSTGTASNTAKPATDAKAKPRKPGQTEALKKGIDELSKEYKDYTAKPDSSTLRTTADYYKELPADTTVEDILAVCNGSLPGSPSQQAYVKWQLLSACPAKFDGDHVKMAFAALGKAPIPNPPIGGTPQVKSQLDRAINGKKREDVDSQIVEEFKKEQQKVDDANQPIIAYRKSLLQRLPASYDAFEAQLQELVIRINSGIEANALGSATKSLAGDVRTWATVDAKPEEVNSMAALVRKLKSYKAPSVYYHPSLAGKDKEAAKWNTYAVDFGKDGKALEDLETALKDAGTGGNTLKFKDDGKDKTKKK
jgi:hypothetical protein